jgi:hypothetical protein
MAPRPQHVPRKGGGGQGSGGLPGRYGRGLEKYGWSQTFSLFFRVGSWGAGFAPFGSTVHHEPDFICALGYRIRVRGTRSPVTLGEQASCHTFARPTSKPRPVGSSREHHPDSSPSHRVSRLPPTPTGKLDATSALMASHLPISSELDSSRCRARSFPTRAVVFSVWVYPRTRPDRSRLGDRGMPFVVSSLRVRGERGDARLLVSATTVRHDHQEGTVLRRQQFLPR